MLKNYLKTAWRNILKSKGFSILNIAGLAVGLAVCLLILLYVRAELSYDAYHASAERIYRVQNAWLKPDGSIQSEFPTLAPSYALLLRNDFPEIERLARMWNRAGTIIKAGDRTFSEERFYFAEPEIFDILTIPLVQGDPATALSDVGGIVLSRTTARKYFGDADPMGRGLVLPSADNMEFRVTGVMEDVPARSHIHFDFLASYITLKGLSGSGDADYFHGTRNFSDNVTAVYVRLTEPGGGQSLQAKMPAFLDRHFPPREDEQGRLVKASESRTLHVQKVKDIHLYAHTRADFEPAGDIRTVRLFTVIALFILAIACVNFVNLSTARGVKRAREVGLRKVVGATRRTLAAQFLGESFLITFLALLLAVGLVVLALPAYGRFVGHAFGAGSLFSPAGLGLVAAGFLLTGLAAGIYPALYLAAFRPSTILRGELTRGRGGAALRKALVVFQFAISIALIFSVTVITRQTRFLRTADVGYARDNIICVPVETAVSRRWTDMKAALLREPCVLAATLSKRAPTGRLLDSPGFWAEVEGATGPERLRHAPQPGRAGFLQDLRHDLGRRARLLRGHPDRRRGGLHPQRDGRPAARLREPGGRARSGVRHVRPEPERAGHRRRPRLQLRVHAPGHRAHRDLRRPQPGQHPEPADRPRLAGEGRASHPVGVRQPQSGRPGQGTIS